MFSMIVLPQVYAADTDEGTAEKESRFRNWLLAPTLSNGPKLGLSAGAVAAYLKYFDSESPVSIIGLRGSYSDTQSFVAGLFSSLYWDKDTQRATIAYLGARANNDYDNFQGTGERVAVQSDLSALILQYQHRLRQSPWLLGGYYISSNFNPSGLDDFSDAILDFLDFGEETNAGIGAILTYDTRDNVNNPSTGMFMEARATRFDEAFGGDNDFNSFNIQYTYFQLLTDLWGMHYNTSLLTTPDAPPASQATLRRFRGYTPGEFSAENAWVGQVETRYQFHPRWYAAAFTGVAALVDDERKFDDSENWYPMIGAGVQFILKEESEILLRFDIAWGKDDNRAVYLNLGQAY